MEKFIVELKKQVSFKDTTVVGDIVLLASNEPRMIVYALITGIIPDPGRKRSWWNVTMQVLAVPPQEVVWTLREPQLTGKEIFTFGGIEHFMKAVCFVPAPSPSPSEEINGSETAGGSRNRLRVIK